MRAGTLVSDRSFRRDPGGTVKREWHHSAGVIVYRDDRPRSYLLMRSALTRRPVWEFPKGGLEPGESELEAAERELEEETGLAEGDFTLLDGFREEERYYFSRGSGADLLLIRKRVTYFLAEWQRGEIQLSREASRYEWATAEEAMKMLRFPEKRRILARAEEWLAQRERQPR
jgi:bis(5'-nucleosidyl)-tetraphosphatase